MSFSKVCLTPAETRELLEHVTSERWRLVLEDRVEGAEYMRLRDACGITVVEGGERMPLELFVLRAIGLLWWYGVLPPWVHLVESDGARVWVVMR